MDHSPAGGSKLASGPSFAAKIGEGSISGTIGRCFDNSDVVFTGVTSEAAICCQWLPGFSYWNRQGGGLPS